MAYCSPCERDFVSQVALEQHLTTSMRHVDSCARCGKQFDSPGAKEQHIRDSTKHNVCHDCPQSPDFGTEAELDEHLERVHHHCIECDRDFNTSDQLTQHDVSKHNMCSTCRTYFQSASNLASVSIS